MKWHSWIVGLRNVQRGGERHKEVIEMKHEHYKFLNNKFAGNLKRYTPDDAFEKLKISFKLLCETSISPLYTTPGTTSIGIAAISDTFKQCYFSN